MWRFGKRTVEKPLDSEERENSTKTRQTDRRWLRLTGFATTLHFLPYWSSRSIIPFFLSFLPPSLHLSVHPPPLLPSLVSYSLATSFPDQLCFANSSAIHYARPAGVTLNTHRDPKQVPHTQNTHTQTHSIGSGSSRGITLNCRGKICRECGQKGCSGEREKAQCCCQKSTAGGTTWKDGKKNKNI